MGSVPPLLLIGTGIVMLANLLHFIGLGTPHWVETSVYNQGLFRVCIDDKCADIGDDGLKSSFEATRAMIILGMLAGMGGAVLAIVFVIFKLMGKNAPNLLTIICTVACFAATGLIIIGVIIYAADFYESEYMDFGYSFSLCIVAAILMGVGGILVFLGGKSVE